VSQALTSTAPLLLDPIRTLPELPARSLGSQVFAWCQEYIRQPDGPDAGARWRFTPEQVRFLHCLYALDGRGRFLWSRAVFRRAKGHGKSPMMAALALAELCGPVRYGGDDANGDPVGVRVSMPWVQIAGVSEKQTTNTMSMVLAMLAESPIVDDYGLDPGLTRIYSAGGGRLEPISASAPTAEGARPTFCVLDETHLWGQANGGHKLAEVIRRNLGKSRDGMARSVETTNAHEQGMESVAERSYEAWQAQISGRARGTTVLYDSREAPPAVELADEPMLLAALSATYGDSSWVDLERIRDEVYDPGTPASESRRFYLNQLSVAEDAWLSPQEFDACADPLAVVADKDVVTLGFDGSVTDDHTALIGCHVESDHLFELGVWHPTANGEIDRAAVDLEVRRAFERFDVVGFYADLHPWESYVDRWAEELGADLVVKASTRHPVAWDMRSRLQLFTQACERLHDALVERVVSHDGAARMREHFHNARRRSNRWGVGVGKEHRESARKIDSVPAAVLARLARQDYVALPASKRRRVRTGKASFL
jgi:phage terminase large subunit-like protein